MEMRRSYNDAIWRHVCDAASGRCQLRHTPRRSQRRRRSGPISLSYICLALLLTPQTVDASHRLLHSRSEPLSARDDDLPLRITNNCRDDIWPGVGTQAGTGPGTGGFKLSSGDSKSLTVSSDWQGRVWGRTNCTENWSDSPQSGQGGAPCSTGDCGNFLSCQGTGQPSTLAEFNYHGYQDLVYYDISLVDGYNLPMAIRALVSESTNSNLTDIPPNLTNPVCIGSASLLTSPGDTSDAEFGTNSSYPLPLEQSISVSDVAAWCPFPLLILPPQKPGDGVYPYPDDNIQRPIFSPCLSACSKWNKPQYCCTGSHSDYNSCKPSYYSTQAKKVCPDAYTFAYDDATSTFAIPKGVGFEVVFCPAGRSTTILTTFKDQLDELNRNGHVTRDIEQMAMNTTYIAEKSEAAGIGQELVNGKSMFALVVLMFWMCLY